MAGMQERVFYHIVVSEHLHFLLSTMTTKMFFFLDGYPNNTEEFYDLLDEFLQSTFGLPFSKYIELSESKPKNIKVGTVFN